MSRSLFSVTLVVLALALVSAVYTYFRAGVLSSPDQLAAKGLAAASRDTAVFYAGVAVIVGLIGYFIFQGMLNAAPATAPRTFLLLAIGIGVVFEIMGAIVFKGRGLLDLTLLHVLFIAAYGWYLPQVFPS